MAGRESKQSPEITEALRFLFEECGCSPTEVAKEVGVVRQSIYDWKDGHEPAYRYGKKLLAIAARLREQSSH